MHTHSYSMEKISIQSLFPYSLHSNIFLFYGKDLHSILQIPIPIFITFKHFPNLWKRSPFLDQSQSCTMHIISLLGEYQMHIFKAHQECQEVLVGPGQQCKPCPPPPSPL